MPIRSSSEKYGQSQASFSSSASSLPVRKPGAKRFSFIRAELGDHYPFSGSVIDRPMNSMEYQNNHISEDSFDRQYQAYRAYSDSDDLDNLVLYNTVDHATADLQNVSYTNHHPGETQSLNNNMSHHSPDPRDVKNVRYYSGDPREMNLFNTKERKSPHVPKRQNSIVKLEQKAEVGQRINQFEGVIKYLNDPGLGEWVGYEEGNHVQNRSLEEESQRPEVKALFDKYQPFSYTTPGSAKGQGQFYARLSQSPHRGESTHNHGHTKSHIEQDTIVQCRFAGSPLHVKSAGRTPPGLSQSDLILSKRADRPRSQSSDRSRKRTRFHQLDSSARSDSESDPSPNKAAFNDRQQVQISPRGTRRTLRSTSPRGSPEKLRPPVSPKGVNSINKISAGSKTPPPRGQNSLPPLPTGAKRCVNDISPRQRAFWEFQPRAMDDSFINLPSRAHSDSSERSSRIDPQVYQSYAAGILHSSHRSNKFLKLQNRYATLGRIAAIEEQTVAKNYMSGKGRFNLVDVRSKSLGSLAPQSQSDNILLSKYNLENVWELKELYADLEEAQDDEEFLFDTGRIEEFQWNPWDDWGIQNKEMSTQQLQQMFEQGGNQNTQASLQKLYRGIQLDFRRALSFRRLFEKYKHLDEETRKQRIIEEWALGKLGDGRTSESSSVLSYGSNMAGSYIEMMNNASSKAKQRALYGYHIQEEYNNYEKHVMRMKKLTKSCPDVNRLLETGDTKYRHKDDYKYTSKDLNKSLPASKAGKSAVSRSRPRSKSEHRTTTRIDAVLDETDLMTRKKKKTEISDLLREELGEATHSKVSHTSVPEIRRWDELVPPWRTQKTPSPVSEAANQNKGEGWHTSKTKGRPVVPRLNLDLDKSTKGGDTTPLDELDGPSRSRSRTKVKSVWRSEVRGVMGNQGGISEPHQVKTSVSDNLELLDRKLEKFKQRHGWRKDSKPEPGTVSKALNMFQAMGEEEIIPEHYEPLVGDGLSLSGSTGSFSYIRPSVVRSDDQVSSASLQLFQRSKSLSAKHDSDLPKRVSQLSTNNIPRSSKLQPSKSDPNIHDKILKNADAFKEAKTKFEEMTTDSDSGSFPRSGLPSRSTKTGLGDYQTRVESKSETRGGITGSKLTEDMNGRSLNYDKFQVEQGKYSHNTDIFSRATWESKEQSLEKHIKDRVQLHQSDLSSNSEQTIQHLLHDQGDDIRRGSEQWNIPGSPMDGRRSRLEMRDGDYDTKVNTPFYTGKNSHGSWREIGDRSNSTEALQPAGSMEYILTRRPYPDKHGQIKGSPSAMYETDLDSSRSQPLSPDRDINLSGQSLSHNVDQLALTLEEAKTMFAALEKQYPREGTKMAIVTPNLYSQEMIHDDTHMMHRSISSDDPSYGDLSKWSHVNITDGLNHQQHKDSPGQLQKWGPMNLSRATMSSNETFIIRDSDPDTSPTHEYAQSFSGEFPSQHQAANMPDTHKPISGAEKSGSVSIRNVRPDLASRTDLHKNQTISSALRRRDPKGNTSELSEDPTRYKWKREYDVPPNVDIDEVRSAKVKKDPGLDRSWDVIRNFTREAGPRDFFNYLERLGKEWQRDKAKKELLQTGADQHMGGPSTEARPLPEYRPPPRYVHPWLDTDEYQVKSTAVPGPSASKDHMNSFHPPNHSTPFTSHSNIPLQPYQDSGDSLSQSKSCPENLTSHGSQYGDVHHTLPLAQPQSMSSQHASHLPLTNTHGMHNEMDRRHGDMPATNQSEHSRASTQNNVPRQRHSVSGTGRSPTGSWDSRRRRDEEAARRKEEMRRVTAEERLKRMEIERRSNAARRHNDFLTPSQKSPIPLNRYDDEPDVSSLQRPTKKVGAQFRGKARALYNFTAQNTKELSFRKNDAIFLLRQIDKNWYEGEHHGLVGIFPVNYVDVLMSLDEARQAAILREGQARAKHSFTAQSGTEVSFRKGDTLNLIRRIDNNWFEGRVDGKHGIFPVSYVEVLCEPDTPLPTPMSSYAPTPNTGSPGQLSPVSTISNGPAPTIPSAPISPRSSVDNFDFAQPFSFQQYPSASASLQRGSGRDHSYADYGLDPLNMMRPASALGGPINDSYSSLSRDRYNRPSSAVPFTDYSKQSTRDSGFYSSEESKHSRQKQREHELMRSLSNPYEGRQSSYGRQHDDISKQEEPRYPLYKALYTYRPQNADELELREGDVVYVMERCDDDWYVGTSERTKEFGTFPGNYVKPL